MSRLPFLSGCSNIVGTRVTLCVVDRVFNGEGTTYIAFLVENILKKEQELARVPSLFNIDI